LNREIENSSQPAPELTREFTLKETMERRFNNFVTVGTHW